MNIRYDSYRVFYYAAKYKSFSKAAAALYNTQPNVSRIIRKLEAELRCALFSRSPQGVILTPKGEKLYEQIAAALESIESASDAIFSDQSLTGGTIRIAASCLALHGCLLQVLERYRTGYPHVRICLTNHTTPQGLAAVRDGLVDFAVVSEGTAIPDSLIMHHVGAVHEIPVCGATYRALAREHVSLARLADYPIVSLSAGTSSHDFYSGLFCSHDLPFAPDVEVETIDQILLVVRCNLGIGFVPQEMLYGTPELTGIYPLTLDDPIPPRGIYMFQRKDQPLSNAASHLQQMLLDAYHPQKYGGKRRLRPASPLLQEEPRS